MGIAMRPTGLHLLLVSTSREWTRAVETAAARIGAGAVEAAGSGREAIARLVNTPRPYSHVLVQPSCSDGLIEDLHGLTSGEVGSDTRLLLLGPPATPAPRIQVIVRASPRSVGAALADAAVEWPNGPPPGMRAKDVRDALTGSMIETRYQPVVRMSDGACVGMEALARLRHPAHGMLAPTHFVPQVENAGLAGQLTDAVARHALAELSRPALDGRDLTIALNFPLDIVLVPETMTRLNAQCAAAGVRPEQIIVELTESRPVEDLAALRRAIERVRRGGYGLAIDDLGPSVPHHAALIEMPFTAVKLDIEVIRDMHAEDGRAFLLDTIDTARAQGMTIIAEGVEDRDTWRRLEARGVDHAQGFLISRPLPAAALPIWLDAWAGRRAQLAQALRGEPDHTS